MTDEKTKLRNQHNVEIVSVIEESEHFPIKKIMPMFNPKAKRSVKYSQKPTNRSWLCLSIFEKPKNSIIFASILAILLCPIIPNSCSHFLNVSLFKRTSCARRLILNIHIKDITKHPNQITPCTASPFVICTPKKVFTLPYNTNRPITRAGSIKRFVS